jgi:hypothetical protein
MLEILRTGGVEVIRDQRSAFDRLAPSDQIIGDRAAASADSGLTAQLPDKLSTERLWQRSVRSLGPPLAPRR